MARARRGRFALGPVAVLIVAVVGGFRVPAAASDASPDPSTVVTFLVGLPHPESKLDAAAKAASTPGSTKFRDYLTVKQAARMYGAPPQAEHQLAHAAEHAGLVAEIDATRMFARVSGSVAAWQRVMGQPIQFTAATMGSAQAAGNGPFDVFGFGSPGLVELAGMPTALSSAATWIIPRYTQYVASLDVPGPLPSKPQTRTLIYPGDRTEHLPTNAGSPIGPSCISAAEAPRYYTPWQLSHAYGLAGLQKRVDVAQPRVAVMSLGGGFAQSDVDAAAACFGYHPPKVDIRLGLGIDQPITSLSTESALDLQTVSWVAHDLDTVRFVQVADGAAGFIDGYSLALTAWPTPPDAITDSWGGGGCEGQSYERTRGAVEPLLKLAAIVGTSVFASAGDHGSSVCQVDGASPTDPRPTVGYPASSPFMTAVGGTQLNLGAGNIRVGESVWNDLQYGITGNAAGTGGPSALFDAPWYQSPITDADVRSVPDIAAQAGLGPGTDVYTGGDLRGIHGGTSQASPLVATGFAMISAQLRADGMAPLGFVNPWIYRTARIHNDALYDVTVGNNQYPVTYAPNSLNVPACCQAGPGFDQASGLGAPLFDKLLRYADPSSPR